MDKNCTLGYPIQCKYQTIGGSSIGSGCTYFGYCDHQLPRDSRGTIFDTRSEISDQINPTNFVSKI
jgi:hypothetical protein